MKPFRVLYAGRLERDKGLFDLIEVAARLEAIRPGQFVWTICGAGSAEREFVETVETRKLLASITFRGRLRRPELAREYAACDAVLVPTSARFPEGLNRSALEAALSGKPVVISSTAPAAELLGQAALVVLAGDIDGYAAELRRLAEDAGLYRTSCEAALRVGATLVDPSMSFRKVLGDVLEQLLPPTPVGQTAREIRAEAARNRSR
jgi:glycosyltransferase involved in cell wall biosynthesis